MDEITQELVEEWKAVFKEFKSLLHPNKKNIDEVIQYIKSKYPIIEDNSQKIKQIVLYNITMNEVFSKKISKGKNLIPIVFRVINQGKGSELYENRDIVYENCPIIIFMEFQTRCVFVEGSIELSDQLTAFQGLDDDELTNYYLVANYIRCLKRYDLLENVINNK